MVETIDHIFRWEYGLPQIPVRATTSSGRTWDVPYTCTLPPLNGTFTIPDDSPKIEVWNKVWGEIGLAYHKKVFCES